MLNLFSYGQHYPNAYQAVQWVTSPIQGTFREISKIEYLWNYYDFPQPLPVNHPYNKDALIAYSDGNNFTTCRDANAHLFFDFNHNGEIDDEDSLPNPSYGYMEHSGRGMNNELHGNPFSNFWFDDNSLAKWMNLAYFLPIPNGLHEYDDFTRWRIVGGNATNWTPYPTPSGYNDQLALNGLYYLAINEINEAKVCWKKILMNSKAIFNATTALYEYPAIHESYHFGLWLILTSMLQTIAKDQDDFLQHYLSIRSTVLSIQVKDVNATLAEGPFYGWTSDAAGGGSLMNTESVSTNVLGLGANALYTYEFGRSPLSSDAEASHFILQPYNVLATVNDVSSAGYLSDGPNVTLNIGNYTAEFFVRSGTITSASDEKVLLNLEVYDSSFRVLSQRDITGKDIALNNYWTRISTPFVVESIENKISVRIWYAGCESIEVSILRIKEEDKSFQSTGGKVRM